MRSLTLFTILVAALACAEAEDQLDQAVEEIDEATGVDTLEGAGQSGPAPHRRPAPSSTGAAACVAGVP